MISDAPKMQLTMSPAVFSCQNILQLSFIEINLNLNSKESKMESPSHLSSFKHIDKHQKFPLKPIKLITFFSQRL